MVDCSFCFQASGGRFYRFKGEGGGFAAFFYWAMPESGIQVTGYQS